MGRPRSSAADGRRHRSLEGRKRNAASRSTSASRRAVTPAGRRVGIVDVAGHERFVRNMLAASAEIDAVLLVIAADEGVMPQTREHFAIVNCSRCRAG
jgi:selenocysteine-specific translation elongation factor